MSKSFDYCSKTECKIPKTHAPLIMTGGDKLRYAIRVHEFVDYLRDTGDPDGRYVFDFIRSSSAI
jgi:hypothetical protein